MTLTERHTNNPARHRLRPLVGAITALALTGCAVAPQPITLTQQTRQTDADMTAIFAHQEPVAAPVTLYQALARALKYNLDRRVKLMEQAYAKHQFDAGKFDMLPKMVADVQRSGRNNTNGASSSSLLTGTQSLEPSTSEDKQYTTQNLSLVWNVLDFGVSYVQAKQQANQVLIAGERRRRAVQNIIQDVRKAYWRALAAQRLIKRVDPLMQQVAQALDDSKRIEQRKLSAPMQALAYQRTLLDTLRQLESLRQALISSKTRLAALMNLPPDQEFTLAVPTNFDTLPTFSRDLAGLERYALLHRPEIREAGYKSRISAEESRKALLRLLPGIEVDYGWNYNSNSFLYNNHWQQYGMKVSWNLFNIFSAKPRLDAAHASEALARKRRLALNMAVLTQVHIAYLDAAEAMHSFDIDQRLANVDSRILDQMHARASTNRSGKLDLIRTELDSVITQLRRDMAYADANNAIGQIYVSIGADPLPSSVDSLSIDNLAKSIETSMTHWQEMKLPHGKS